ncbi:MAG: hypothetical protein HY315_02820 [Acidobacteria bacterium]|nr:hypothetical protein [Acidobacteriota bacterium]
MAAGIGAPLREWRRIALLTAAFGLWMFSAAPWSPIRARGVAAAGAPAQTRPAHPSGNPASDPDSEAAESRLGYRPLVAALHVHSRYSNGHYEILELAAYAHERKLDVLGITDSFLTQVRYGVGPWKKLIAQTRSRASVMTAGVETYLSSFDDAQRQFSDVVMLPGVEVAPYYYWQGSYRDDLQLFNFDRHLLVFGLSRPAVLRDLPVVENETWTNTPRDWSRAWAPAVLLVGGIVLFFLRRQRVVRLRHFSLRKRADFRALAAGLLVLGAAGAYNNYPFGRLSDPYSGRHDPAAYQRVIDYVAERGGMTFWSYPDAPFPEVKVGGARFISASHPEDLALTDRYRGFEGIYGGKFATGRPGGIWDRLLLDGLRNERKSWPSVITGIDFHYFKAGGGWYELNRGQTVLWAKKKDLESVLDALRQGRGYAIYQPAAGEVVLRDFAVGSGENLAISGETLRTGGPVNLTAVVNWHSPRAGLEPPRGRFEVIRNGTVVESAEQSLPMAVNRTELLPAGKHYYRLRIVFGLSRELLSNPIFVEVAQ